MAEPELTAEEVAARRTAELEAEISELQKAENTHHEACQAVYAKNVDIARRDADDDLPYPSKNERRAVRDEIVLAERKLHAVQEQIRVRRWELDGIEEGPPLTIGFDNTGDRVLRTPEER